MTPEERRARQLPRPPAAGAGPPPAGPEEAAARSARLEDFIADPRRGLWSQAVPMMLGMSIQTAYMIVDMIFVGRVGPEALTALAFNMPLLFFAIGVTFGLGSGVTAVIAQAIGARDKAAADNCANHGVALGLLSSLAFTTVGLFWGRALLAALGVPAALMAEAWSYFSVLAGGFVFMATTVFFRAILAGEGEVRTPVAIQGSGTVLNIALDPLFIFTFGLGVQGAAVATVVSQALVAVAFVVLLFVKGRSYVSFDLARFRPSGEILAGIFNIGLPASFSFLVMAFGGGVFNRILITYSADAVAAYQVGMRLDHIFVLPTMSIAAGLVTLVGMFYGARRFDLVEEVVRYGMTRGVAIAAAIGALFFFLAPQLVAAFSADPGIRAAGAVYLRIIVFAYPFAAVAIFAGRILQGLGQGVPMLVLSTLRVVLIAAPMASVFAFWLHKPVEWVWISMVVATVASATLALAWLRRDLVRLARDLPAAEAVPV